MRCPKCGYISFDHLETCLNCSKDLSDSLSSVQGTTYHATPPMFLQISSDEGMGEDAREFETDVEEMDDDLEVVDPDLDILLKEETDSGSEEALSQDSFGVPDEGDTTDFDEDAEEEDREIEIDLSQFEDAGAEKEAEAEPAPAFSMDLPDELADISDLAPPVSSEQKPVSDTGPDEAEMEMGDMDLKLDDMESDFSLTSETKEPSSDEGFAGLSLDDIDLSDDSESKEPTPPPPPKAAPAAGSEEMDMDADLNFDLDLGGLTLPPKK